jgi:hypothetical protein
MDAIQNISTLGLIALSSALLGPDVSAARPKPAPPRPLVRNAAPTSRPIGRGVPTGLPFGKGPETITFERFTGRGGFYPIREIGRYAGGHYDEIVTQNGKNFAHGVKFFCSEKQYVGQGGGRIDVRYPDLMQGHVVRMLDGLYRLKSVTKAAATFKRLKRAEFPKGVSVAEGSYGFPIGSNGSFSPSGRNVPTILFKDPATAKDRRPEVTVAIGVGYTQTSWLGPPLQRERVLHKGDIARIGPCGHRVLNIVLPDPKRGIVGWVDFDARVAGLRGPASFRLHRRRPSLGGRAPEPPRKTFGFISRWAPDRPRYGNGFLRLFRLRAAEDTPGLFDHAVADKFSGSFGRIDVGQAVRIFDGVYRLADNHGLFNRVPLKDLPKDARTAPHSYGIPFGQARDDFVSGAGVNLHESPEHRPFVYWVRIVAYRKFNRFIRPDVLNQYVDKQYRGKTAVTEVLALVHTGETREKVGFGTRLRWTFNSQWIKVGDLLRIGPYAHRVKKIVLPDPKRKIAGWVDIDQDVAKTKKK